MEQRKIVNVSTFILTAAEPHDDLKYKKNIPMLHLTSLVYSIVSDNLLIPLFSITCLQTA